MDANGKELAIVLGLGVAAYVVAKHFIGAATATKIGPGGELGGVAGTVGDVFVGAKPKDASETMGVYGPPNPNAYFGRPVLAHLVDPLSGQAVQRQPFRKSYPVVIDVQNMTDTPISGRFLWQVDEEAIIGGGVVSTETELYVLTPGERRRFNLQINTETVFTVARATARVMFADIPLGTFVYLIS